MQFTLSWSPPLMPFLLKTSDIAEKTDLNIFKKAPNMKDFRFRFFFQP